MALTFKKIEPTSKKACIVESLKKAIISGEIISGEQIVEGKLAQQLGVGQGVIREALIELEHNGFVQRTPFSGTQVAELTLLDAQQIYDIRIELEPLAFFLAGPNADIKNISALSELIETAAAASKVGDISAFFENHLTFRKTIWNLSNNPYLQQILERTVIPLYALYIIRQSDNLEGLLRTTVDCIDHQSEILTAYNQKNFEEARNAARKFLIKMKDDLGTRLPPASVN